MYDVIVAGAGPAGCTAAKTLAEQGCSVLLVERCRLPRYKSCSGILIKKSIDLLQRYFGEATPDWAACTPADNQGMIFTNDKGQEFCFGQQGLNVWRSSFDYWLARKAVCAGAELLDGTDVVACKETSGYLEVTMVEKVPFCEPDTTDQLTGQSQKIAESSEKKTIWCESEIARKTPKADRLDDQEGVGTRTRTEHAKYVLDCEGATGVLKRKLTGCKKDYITTYQAFYDGEINLDYHYFYAYLQPELSEYDAWFNVKDNKLILGVAVKDVRNIKIYYKKFLDYMKQRHGLKIEKKHKEERWLMPYIHPGCPVDYGIGRVLFAGEIAGFLNPMGEGISAGMESGFLAACAAAEHLNDPAAAKAQYKQTAEPLKSYMRRQWAFVARTAGTFQEMEEA